jgi:type II secretory pathway pseudopilin PulG
MPDQVIHSQRKNDSFFIVSPANHLWSSTSAGFTLIELLISITLGIGIIYVAFSGVRIAAQATSSIKRMSLSNELLANGVHLAMEEIDHWGSYDDPADITRQRLRASASPASATTVAGGTLVLGLPFNRFNAGVPAPAWSSGSAQDWGNGWQDDERLWAVSADNELTWWTGNKAETLESDCRFGHYTIFGISRKPNENPVLIDGGTSDRIGAWQPRHGGG